MNKISKLISIVLLLLITSTSFAEETTSSWAQNEIKINSLDLNNTTIKEVETENNLTVTREYIIIYLGEFFVKVPESYKYINLKFKLLEPNSAIEKTLKKLVYLDKIENVEKNLYLNKTMTAYSFYALAKDVLELDMKLDKVELSKRNVRLSDLETVKNTYNYYKKDQNVKIETPKSTTVLWDKEEIFNDVYNTILWAHYNHENINKDDLIYGAIEWLANAPEDKHTVYFPPIESKSFEDSLSWEYEWIGSYVEMTSPGELKITSPIPGGPAEKAWLKWWDIVTKVDEKEITKENSLTEVISWIKGPAGSTVILTVNRNWTELKIEVKREKITIKNLEYSKINSNTYNIQIKTFGAGVANEFKTVLEEIKSKWNTKKIIIDLRNNWGWYLNEVTEMLGYVVPEWEKTAVVKYNWWNNNFYSKWLNIVDLNKYEVIILQNSGTASASEIMIWTLKDYFPKIVSIGENTYWKWSVQTMKQYDDGSSFKYTIAKWFTWKTETWIDWVWFKADIELEYDLEAYKLDWVDNQLQRAISQ